jgi:Acetyl-CoA carboxylase alpha subunit
MKAGEAVMKAMDNVLASRAKTRPGGVSYIRNIFTGFIELHGDRRFGDDKAIIGGLAYLSDVPVTVIATEKGWDAKSSAARNFGLPHPEGYRKALRLMRQAEKFHRPVICFVNTSGAYCGVGAEERGMGQAIAENLMEMTALRTPIISVMTGEGGSGGALALAVANEVWMLEKSYYSVISPEGCASILYRDSKHAEQAAENLKLTAADLLRMGVVERVFNDEDYSAMFEELSEALIEKTRELMLFSADEVVAQRKKRFRNIGAV